MRKWPQPGTISYGVSKDIILVHTVYPTIKAHFSETFVSVVQQRSEMIVPFVIEA